MREVFDTGGFLGEMIARRRADIAERYGALNSGGLERIAEQGRPVRDFAAALVAGPSVALVAEVKKASPSSGPIAPDVDACAQARAYERGGAAAVSVLTEPSSFGGSFEDLARVSEAVALPVLAKDFVVEPAQLHVARGCGADAVLLMVSVLGDAVAEYLDLAWMLGLKALVEVLDEAELAIAADAGARIIGVNARDLRTLRVDRAAAAVVVAAASDAGLVTVAASGVSGAGDVTEAAGAGADAVLVGEALMRADDPEAACAALAGVRRRKQGLAGPGARSI